jgi:hypothetical protein
MQKVKLQEAEAKVYAIAFAFERAIFYMLKNGIAINRFKLQNLKLQDTKRNS